MFSRQSIAIYAILFFSFAPQMLQAGDIFLAEHKKAQGISMNAVSEKPQNQVVFEKTIVVLERDAVHGISLNRTGLKHVHKEPLDKIDKTKEGDAAVPIYAIRPSLINSSEDMERQAHARKDSRSDQPNITPYQPDGWDDKIVVSNKTETHTDDAVYAGETVYIDYAYINYGDANANGIFYIELYANGTQIRQASKDGLKQLEYGSKSDFEHTFPQAGTYTLKLVCDANDNIAESDETDNEYQRDKIVATTDMPNLTPYQPEGWDDKIVVSAATDTHTEEAIYSGATAYIDYAYDNNGGMDIDETFYVELHVNGSQVSRTSVSGLKQGEHGDESDAEYTFPQPGTYTLKLVCDADDDISESNENDNEYQRGKSTSDASLPDLIPYQPENWDDKIVVSNKTGTNSDDILYAGDTAYIDYAYINAGESDISETFYVDFHINGTRAKQSVKNGLPKGGYGASSDVEYTFPQAGTYTLQLICDADNKVAESDENNNEYERTKEISASIGMPNITPYKPDSWDDKLVVSDKSGTHSDDIVYAGETAYIDYAFINNGDTNIHETFHTELHINGEQVTQDDNDKLNKGDYGYHSDIEYTFSQAGTYTLKFVCDADNNVAESNEDDNEYEMTKNISVLTNMNITPHQPEGWKDKIVVSDTSGDNTDSTIYAGETAYIDYAYINDGDANIDRAFYVAFYVNGDIVRRAHNEELKQGYHRPVSDFEYSFPHPGTYTLKLVCDSDDEIPEVNETDNEYERTVTVLSSALSTPNLTPYKPNNWDDKIVVSNKSGTHTDDIVYVGETVYIDYAYINNGSENVKEAFYTDLYINADKAARSGTEALDQGKYAYIQDFKYTFSEAGTYTIKVKCDAEDDIAESYENDNTYQRSMEISTGGEPDIRIEPSALVFDASDTGGRRRQESVEVLQDRAVRFLRGTIHPEATFSSRSRMSAWEGERRHILIQFAHLPSPEEQAELAARGIRVLRYIPNHTYWVSADPAKRRSAETMNIAGGIQWSHVPAPKYKISEAIERNAFPDNARYEDGTVRIHVLIFEDVSKEEAVNAIVSVGDGVQFAGWVSAHVAAVQTRLEMTEHIADLDQVEWVEPASPTNIRFNETAAERITADALRDPPLRLKGEGVIIGVWDGGSVFTHDDFGNRLTVKDGAKVSDHATHVAGTIGGGGLGKSDAKGMAPAVSIWSYDWNDDQEEMRQAVEDGMVISNHSYGFVTGWYRDSEERLWKKDDTGFGQYSAIAEGWDDIIVDTGLIVFKAAGNDRDEGQNCPDGPDCDGPYDCIPQQGVSKNTITIGATDDNDIMTSFSSWGPANDGRIKPDLCANGYLVQSTLPDGKYGAMSGTSMATPAAAGAAVLLYQHFKIIADDAPKPETLKALMIHGAKDLGRIGPDYEYGWGLIDAEETADLITRRAWQTASLSATGSSQTYTLTVSENTPELKVTLVWTDPAGSPSADKALVNDLDLTLTDPNGVQYKPWILDKDDPTAGAARGANHLDNVEQAVVSRPITGAWTVNVSGFAIPSGPQNFTVAAKGISTNSKSFTIYNDGTDSLSISGIEKEADAEWLSYLPGPPFTIDPGKSQTVTVTIDTDLAGSQPDDEKLLVYSNDADESPYSVSVRLGSTVTAAIATDNTSRTFIDTPVTIDVLDNDSGAAGSSLTITDVTTPDHGIAKASVDNKTILYTPGGGFIGEDAFSYTMSDGATTARADVTVSVELEAIPLAAGDDVAQAVTNTSVTVYVLSNDTGPMEKTLTVTDVSDPDHGEAEVNSDNRTVLYTPGSNFTGEDTFTYTMSDGTNSDQAGVTVTVKPPAVPLTAADDTAKTDTDTPVTIRVLDNDSGNTLTVMSVSGPSHGDARVNADNKTVLYTPGSSFAGTDTFTYTISDGTDTKSAAVTVTVETSAEECKGYVSRDTPLNIPDSDASGVISVLMLTAAGEVRDVNVSVNITHTWADDVSVYLTSPAGTQITLFENVGGDGENFIETTLDDEAVQSISNETAPFTGYYRPVSPLKVLIGDTLAGEWKLQVTDAEESDTGILNSWTLMVCYLPSSENRPPTVTDDSAVTPLNAQVTIDVLNNDSDLDGDTLTVTEVSDPPHGTCVSDAENNKIVYTPDSGFSGTDSFTCTVSDGKGGSGTSVVKIQVHASENLIKNGDFETPGTEKEWNDNSILFSANVYQNKALAHSGEWLTWFEGNGEKAETASVTQNVTIPEARQAVLRFWLMKYMDNLSGTVTVSLDDQILLTATEDIDGYQEWSEVVLDASDFADGNTHTLRFDAAVQVGVGATSFLVDDVILITDDSPLLDAIAMLQMLAGMNPKNMDAEADDISDDGRIGLEEVISLLRDAAGLSVP